MPERHGERAPERQRIEREIYDISSGPIHLGLSDHEISIVVPERDLGESLPFDCIVIDPNNYDLTQDRGFVPLSDNESVMLGRKYHKDRFNFSEFVSGEHAMFTRVGQQVAIYDLGSTNGTFKLAKLKDQQSAQTNDSRPKTELSSIKVAGFSVASRFHPDRNEDSFFINDAKNAIGVFDGMGGISAPEKASRLASHVVSEYLRTVNSKATRAIARAAIYEALWKGHEAVLDDLEENAGTTGIVAKVFETEKGAPYAVIGSAGDSRAYLFRDGQLAHLTLDHAFKPSQRDPQRLQDVLADVTDLSKVDTEARHAFDNRNLITSYLGKPGRPPVITVADHAVETGDKIFLTSDGIHDNLTSKEIAEIVRLENTANGIVKALVSAAYDRSREGHLRSKADDMTATALVL